MTSKSASVFALDISCAASLDRGRQVCMQTAIEKMLYTPHDELGLVFAGADSTLNPLYTSADGRRYGGLRVECGLAVPTAQFLEPLEALAHSRPTDGPCDILEALILCTHLLHERTACKKYSRTIYLITDARHEVARKQEIQHVLSSLGAENITLMVVGIDFTEDNENAADEDWTNLGVKPQNERVLHFMCRSLGGSSMVVSLEEVMTGMQCLRRRRILQRPLLKVVLVVGDIHLAVQLFTKVQEEKLPSLRRVVAATGDDVMQASEYVRVGEAQDDGKNVVPASERVKAFHYGRSLIPCTEADLEAMKVKGRRSLETIAFVGQHEVPPYVTMGGVKVVLPLAGDLVGQKGFACLVHSMADLRKAMVVRFVRTKDANPVLGVCYPSCKPGGRFALFFAPLPFAEDVRQYRFPEYDEVVCSAGEQQLVSDLVNAMTAEKETLRPNESFNPVLQQYYATLREKLLKIASGTELAVDKGGSDVPLLIPQLQATSTAFAAAGNRLEGTLRRAEAAMADCASAFPYIEAKAPDVQQRTYWFHTDMAGAGNASDASSAAPSTVVAAALRFPTASQEGSRAASTAEAQSTVAHLVAPTTHVTTIDPVGTFRALVLAEESNAVARTRAMDQLVDVVFQLLRFSMKDAHYNKCDACLEALRHHCVTEEEPVYYNNFLVKLMVVAEETGHEEGYWSGRVLTNKAVQPITQQECGNSSLADEKAARLFMAQDRSVPAPDLGDEVDDDLMDLIY